MKNFRMIRYFGMIFVFVGFSVGCASVQPGQKLVRSPSFADFQTDENDSTIKIYRLGDQPLKGFQDFLMDPVLVYLPRTTPRLPVQPDLLKEISDLFETEINASLRSFTRTDERGPKAIRVKMVIYNLKDGFVDPALFETPDSEIKINLDGALVYVELLNSQTNTRLLAIAKSFELNESPDELTPLKQLSSVRDGFAAIGRRILNEVEK